ncbi:MAG TPA: SpoIIE family protein phosphatase [Acidobacteriota bacterium]|nr:SpoIIE family protein phosphatase [Acidobacteriota bacterium]
MIRVMLVDDEQPARERLRSLLDGFGELKVVGEACDGLEALRQIGEMRPDLVFLDIQMPGASGTEVAARLPAPRPRVVFCTAFDDYALDAFELHAVDYLLKPVTRKRLQRTVGKVRDALASARRGNELQRARGVQSRLLEKARPSADGWGLEGLEVGALCRPATEVGGDYYDFISLPANRLGIALGDVSGKGVPAGLVMAGLQGRLETLAPQHGDQAAALLTEINRRTWQATESNMYVTFFYAAYDQASRRFSYVNAGHPPGLLFPAGHPEPRRLECGGTPVGLFPAADYRQEDLNLSRGDTVVLYSDGLIEAADSKEQEFGLERVVESASEVLDDTPDGICRHLLERVREHAATPQDDCTVLVMKIKEG